MEMEKKKAKLKIKHIGYTGYKKFVFPQGFCDGQQAAEKKEMLAELLKAEGRFYACYLNKEMIGYVVIEKLKEELAPIYATPKDLLENLSLTEKKGQLTEIDSEEFPQDTEVLDSEEKLETVSVYRLKEFCIKPEYEECRAQIKEFLLAELKEMAEWYDCHAIIWEDEIIHRKKVKEGSSAWAIGSLMGISIGLLFGVAFDNVGLGACIGFAIGSASSACWTAVGNVTQDADDKDVAKEDAGGGACR